MTILALAGLLVVGAAVLAYRATRTKPQPRSWEQLFLSDEFEAYVSENH